MDGYKDGLKAAGIPYDDELIAVGDYTTESAVGCAHQLLTLKDRPTAIFASNDMSAMGVYQTAEELGIKIPDDLSVMGFDNIHESQFLNPTLTTIDQFVSEMGYIAVEMVIKLINNGKLENDLRKIETQLIVRDSCRAQA
jgi:LacI family transcriptional regulator